LDKGVRDRIGILLRYVQLISQEADSYPVRGLFSSEIIVAQIGRRDDISAYVMAALMCIDKLLQQGRHSRERAGVQHDQPLAGWGNRRLRDVTDAGTHLGEDGGIGRISTMNRGAANHRIGHLAPSRRHTKQKYDREALHGDSLFPLFPVATGDRLSDAIRPIHFTVALAQQTVTAAADHGQDCTALKVRKSTMAKGNHPTARVPTCVVNCTQLSNLPRQILATPCQFVVFKQEATGIKAKAITSLLQALHRVSNRELTLETNEEIGIEARTTSKLGIVEQLDSGNPGGIVREVTEFLRRVRTVLEDVDRIPID
jgi:hypothetical protein